MKNRRFQLGLVRFLPGFYRNTHREPLNTTTKGFGLEPQRSTGLVFGLKSDSRQYQLVLFFRFRSKSVPQKSAYARGFDLRSNSVPQQEICCAAAAAAGARNKGASAWGWSLFYFAFDLRSKSVEAIVARFASKKLDSRFCLRCSNCLQKAVQQQSTKSSPAG